MRSLALALLLGAHVLTACAPGARQRPADLPPLPSTMTLVVSHLAIDLDDRNSVGWQTAYGFDLDSQIHGPTARPCTTAPDYTSAVSGADGVDNQFVGLVSFHDAWFPHDRMQPRVDDQLARGGWLFALRVSQIDDAWDDPEVLVNAFFAEPIGELALDASGAIAPAPSLRRVEELGVFRGRITEQVLRVRLPRATLPMGDDIASPIFDVVLRATIEPDALSDGELGGLATIQTVRDVIDLFVEGPVDLLTAETYAQPDMEPDSDGQHCASMSVGVGFAAVPAILVE